MSHFRNFKGNEKFKVAGEGFFFPVKSITGITDTNIGVKKKKPKPATQAALAKNVTIKQTFSTLGDMLMQKYAVDFIATLKGEKAVITGGELGEWRLTQYQNTLIYSQLKTSQTNTSPISIEHDCGPDPNAGPVGHPLDAISPTEKKWVWAMTPGSDKRRRLCNHCKKRVPETIKGLIKLIE